MVNSVDGFASLIGVNEGATVTVIAAAPVATCYSIAS